MKAIQDRTKGAFTLVETLVALAIITILAALLVPSLLNWQNNVQQDRVRATSTVLSQACVRAGLAGVTVPAANRDTLANLVAWYQENGYLQNSRVDITNLSLADLGGGSFFDCTDGTGSAGGTTSDIYADGSLTPGPVAEPWFNTRYMQIAIPSVPAGAQSLDLEGSVDGQTWTVVASNVTDSYTDGPFEPNTTRYYRVVAVNSGGRSPGPSFKAVTAPPLSAPNPLSVVLGSVTTSGTTPKTPPPAPLTYTLPTVPANPGSSGTSVGVDFGGWQWLLSGTGFSAQGGGGGAVTTTPMTTPGAITINNLTSYSYTLTLPTLPHDLVDVNGRIFDFAWGWMLFSSTNGTTWAYSPACDWRSKLGPPDTKTGFGWTCQQDGFWTDNPGAFTFAATPGTTYYHQLVGQDTAGLMVYGSVISITTPQDADNGSTAPTAPVSPNAPLAPNKVNITNVKQTSLTITMPTLPDRATSMTLEASTDGGNSWVVVASGLGENEVVQQGNLTSAKSYAYCVCAVNAFGTTQGEPQSVVTLGGLPAVPGNVIVGNVTPNSYALTLPQLPNAATSFTLQTSENGITWTNVGTGYGSGAAVTLNGLAPNTSAPYLLLAVNQYGYAPGAPFFATTGGIPSYPFFPTVANLAATSFDLRLPDLPKYATSLTLQISSDGGATWSEQKGLVGLTVVSESATPGSTYNYRLVAVNQWGETPGATLTLTTPETPAAPGNVTVSNLGDTGFQLLMPSLPSGADFLKLETTIDGLDWLAETGHDALAGGATVTESGLTPNTLYAYRVVAVNQWGETPGAGFTVTTAGPPQAPGLTVIGSVTPTSLALHLPGLPVGASFLSLQTSPDNAVWTTVENNLDGGVSVPLTGLTPLTSYNYRLTADNRYGSTPGLPFIGATAGPPAAPEDPTVGSVAPTSLNLTMPALPSGATSLNLFVSTDGATWPATPAASALGAGSLVPQTNLNPNTVYFYRLSAVNDWGTTPGDTLSVTTAGTPAVPGLATIGGIALDAFDITLPNLPLGAVSLDLQTSTDGGKSWIPDGANSGLQGGATVHETGKTQKTTYTYTVLANNSWGSTRGPLFTATTGGLPDAPAAVSVSGLTPSSFQLALPSLPFGATSFNLQILSGTNWITDGTNSNLAGGSTVTETGKTAGATYQYRLSAVNQWGNATGSPFSVTTVGSPTAPATATASGVTSTAFTLTMPTLPANATSLTLQTSNDGGTTWSILNSGLDGGAAVRLTGLTPGATYTYRVVAVNAYFQTAGSSFTVTTASLPAAPGVGTASNVTASSFTLTMPTLPASAASLTLQTSTDGGTTWNTDGANSGLGAGAAVSETGKTAGATYTYRVLAVNAYGSTPGSSFTVSTTAVGEPLPDMPDSPAVSMTGVTSFTLWLYSLPANADSITLQISTDGGTTWVTDGANTGFTDYTGITETGKTPGTTYRYRFLAVNAYGSTPGTSVSVTAGAPAVPSGATYSYVSAVSFKLTMPTLPANAATLTLQTSTDGGTTWVTDGANSGLAGGAVVTKTSMTPGTTYWYRTLAVNAYGSTPGVGISCVAGTPAEPSWTPPAPTSITTTSFKVTMPALTSGATSYTLTVYNDLTFDTVSTKPGLAGGATVTVSGLTTKTSYDYQITAVNAYGQASGGWGYVTTK